MGIFTGKFDSISQAQDAVKNGGIIDGISGILDSVVNKTTENGLLNSNIGNLILKGKDVILDNGMVQFAHDFSIATFSKLEKIFAGQINGTSNNIVYMYYLCHHVNKLNQIHLLLLQYEKS